ncbi:MAG TPA: hypothetical protein VFH58_05310 [Acidimicrobiales bacterium]|nr:hypothetical protein [Acidimicrobiales bacterium]
MQTAAGHLLDGSTLDKRLVRTILQHPDGYPWKLQDIGLLGLTLDERREYRLHVWDPAYMVGEPPVHDHPFDFTSTVIVGELTNSVYREDPAGTGYYRWRYTLSAEDERTMDTVTLAATATTLREGDHYAQAAHELHDSRQLPGTVTLIRRAFDEVSRLTVCYRQESAWVSGQARPATRNEVRDITGKALAWF